MHGMDEHSSTETQAWLQAKFRMRGDNVDRQVGRATECSFPMVLGMVDVWEFCRYRF